MPPYTSIPFPSFAGGLNLRDQPANVAESEAIDALNVSFTERGAVAQRYGYSKFTDSELTNQPDSLGRFYKVDGTRRLMVGNGNKIDVLDTTGVSVANTTSPTASPHYFSRFGGPTIEAVYIGNGTDQIRRYDTAGGFTTPAGLSAQTGRFVAVTPTDNRLAVARETGTTAGNNPSSVNFSNAGAPETFTSTDYVDITPGDGEAIMGMAVWKNFLFVFKESKFAIFSRASTDAQGAAIFNHEVIDSGVGLVSSRALAVGRDGVYFMDRRGVYRTQGGDPQLLSDAIEPFFLGNASIYYKSNTLNHGSITSAAMTWHDERLYLGVPTGTSTTNDRMLVHDPRHGWWSLWDIPSAALRPFKIGNQEELVFAYSTGPNLVGRHNLSFTSDMPTFDVENMALNPSVETNTTGYADNGTGLTGSSTISQDAAQFHSGTKSLKVITAATASNGTVYVAAVSVASGVNVRGGVWVKGNSGGESVAVGIGFDGVADFATANYTLTTGWQRLTVSTTTAGARTSLTVLVRNVPATAQTFFVDDLLVVQGQTTLPDYFDGSMSTAYWTGTAHASTSKRFVPSMTSRWRSGWQDFGTSDQKVVRESKLSGNGTVQFAVADDWHDAVVSPVAVTLSANADTWGGGTGADTWAGGGTTDLWGPANTVREKLVRIASRGRVFSTQFSNSTAGTTWSVHSCVHHLRESRVPSAMEAT